MDERGSWSSLVEPVITSRSSWPMWQECAVTVHKHAPIPCTDEMSQFRSLVKTGCCFCSTKQRYRTTPSRSGQHQSKLLGACLVRGEPGVLTNYHSLSHEGPFYCRTSRVIYFYFWKKAPAATGLCKHEWYGGHLLFLRMQELMGDKRGGSGG